MRTTFITNVHLSLVSMSSKVADEADSGSQKSIADMTHMSRRVWRMNGCEIFTLASPQLHPSFYSQQQWHPLLFYCALGRSRAAFSHVEVSICSYVSCTVSNTVHPGIK